MKPKLKLFIWEGVFCSYSCGIMGALAHNVEEARSLLSGEFKGCSYLPPLDDLAKKPKVFTNPKAFYSLGGD